MRTNKLSVTLVNKFSNPLKNVVSTAKTCYSSKGIVEDESIQFPKDEKLLFDLLKAGHHTTFEHQYFQFAITNVSRYLVWSLLHSHPYYNSEQVSQRYTKVKEKFCYIPDLPNSYKKSFIDIIDKQYLFYNELTTLVYPYVEKYYYDIFPARKKSSEKFQKDIEKKAREIARYVLPIGTYTYLYHTVNILTLLRYFKHSLLLDSSDEEKDLVKQMLAEVVKIDNSFEKIINEIENSVIPLESNQILITKEYKKYFDSELSSYSSKLVDYSINAEKTLADALRLFYGHVSTDLIDKEAIERILNPGLNRILSSEIVLTNNILLTKALTHIKYTFKKKLSHSADSQNQRHRTVQSSSYDITRMDLSEPDYVIPKLIEIIPQLRARFIEMMDYIWSEINKLISYSINPKFIVYLLPNSVAIRSFESGNLLNYHHKYAMRLCYNAQEEIWQNSIDEVKQIIKVHPNIGKFLLPPCTLRLLGKKLPICPEGKRFCGIKVWKLHINDYSRVL